MNTADTPIFHDRQESMRNGLSAGTTSFDLSDVPFSRNVSDLRDTTAEKKQVW